MDSDRLPDDPQNIAPTGPRPIPSLPKAGASLSAIFSPRPPQLSKDLGRPRPPLAAPAALSRFSLTEIARQKALARNSIYEAFNNQKKTVPSTPSSSTPTAPDPTASTPTNTNSTPTVSDSTASTPADSDPTDLDLIDDLLDLDPVDSDPSDLDETEGEESPEEGEEDEDEDKKEEDGSSDPNGGGGGGGGPRLTRSLRLRKDGLSEAPSSGKMRAKMASGGGWRKENEHIATNVARGTAGAPQIVPGSARGNKLAAEKSTLVQNTAIKSARVESPGAGAPDEPWKSAKRTSDKADAAPAVAAKKPEIAQQRVR